MKQRATTSALSSALDVRVGAVGGLYAFALFFFGYAYFYFYFPFIQTGGV